MARSSARAALRLKGAFACHDVDVPVLTRLRQTRHLVSLASLTCLVAGSCANSVDEVDARDVTRSGVGIVADGCGLASSVGSGAIIDQGDGETLVVTVAHTIRGATSVTVVDVDGGEHEARVVAFDKDADLAALFVVGLAARGLAIADDPTASVAGTEGSILTWGPDDGVEDVPVEVVKRLRVTIEDIYIDEVVERTALEVAGAVTGGDSGGPVLDADGDVIGVIYANSRGRELVGFATDQRELTELLDGVTGATVPNGTCF